MEHTKEPWSIDRYNNINTPEGQLGLGGVVTHCTWGAGMEKDRANARRIVACVNACAGASTESLEQHGFLAMRAKQVIELEQQRDELLAKVDGLERELAATQHVVAQYAEGERKLRDELAVRRGMPTRFG